MINARNKLTLISFLLTICLFYAHAGDILIRDGQKIVFLGDSITQMGAAPSGYATQVIRGLAANDIKATMIGAGIGGNRSDHMLARLDSDVIAYKPDWMTLSCGVNDVWSDLPLEQFKQNITKIVEKAQAANIKVAILTATMIGEDPAEKKNQQMLPYNAFLRQLAKEKKCLLADLNADEQAAVIALGGGAQSKRGNVLTVEGIHMNALGNQVMALGLLKSFGMSAEQLEKARQSWLDLPGICEVSFKGGLTLRQYEQLDAMAAKQNRPTSVLIGELVSNILNSAPEPSIGNSMDMAPLRVVWQAPVPIKSAETALNQPGTIAGAAVFGGTKEIVTLRNGKTIDFKADGSVASIPNYNGHFDGTFLPNTTGNANFDAVLNQANWCQESSRIITVKNLVVGQPYAVQFFALDDRWVSTNRTVNFQALDDGTNMSATFQMGDNVYVVGKFVATSSTLTIQQNLPDKNQANLNALIVWHLAPQNPLIVGTASNQQEKLDRNAQIDSLRVVTPMVTLLPAPLKPLQMTNVDQSVLLGHSPEMSVQNGWGDIQSAYDPIEDGGYRISGSLRQFNRTIIQNQNRLTTGDAPIFRMNTSDGFGCYIADKIFPLWPRPDSQAGAAAPPCLGTLRLGVPTPDGKTLWMDEIKTVTTSFRPGYTHYQVTAPDGTWKAEILVAPAPDSNGMICQVKFDRAVSLVWQFGGIWWLPTDKNSNLVQIQGRQVRITETNLPNGLVLAGCDVDCEGRVIPAPFGQQAEFTAKPKTTYNIVAVWGATTYDEQLAKQMMSRLDTPMANAWPEIRDQMKQSWFDCYIKSALGPERRFKDLMAMPADALKKTCDKWDSRRAEFQIRTPDPHLNALINWERARSEYHRKGPGLFLSEVWQNYSHISTGWYGKEWGGDHRALDECLRLYGVKQLDSGAIGWVSPSLAGFFAENNTPYWVDHVWRHYTWTGDKQFVKDLWPVVRKAVSWQRKENDPAGDGLFRDYYEYWNSDSGGKGPKAPTPSAMSWAMLDRAAQMAAVVGDAAAELEYRDLAELSRKNIFTELWRDGRLGMVGSDNLWRGHPQIWDEYLAINAGLLTPQQGRSAMRWLESHYGFEPQPGVKLLSCSDWYPIRWSVQWVPTGDTCLAVLAGLKSGDVDLWWPYLKTAVMSAFKCESPGIQMAISNHGAGSGDLEDVDSADPYLHVAIRGLFGIEPALQNGRIDICPAFPSDWTEASIHSPDISYEYHRKGNQATFKIHTPKPVVKRVLGNLTGPEVFTPAEKESVVTVTIGDPVTPPQPSKTQPIFMDKDGKRVERPIIPLTEEQRKRLVLFDLSSVYNKTVEEFGDLSFIFGYLDAPMPLYYWWKNPRLDMPPTPSILDAANGLRFLIARRKPSDSDTPPKNLLVLSSWQPYPVPGGAVIPVGMRCKSIWPLLYAYVHPMGNYIPNGEIVLHYAGGRKAVTSLIPPFNLDAMYQVFSLEGISVPFGSIRPNTLGFANPALCVSHATALEVSCDPTQILESIEFRAVCSEGVLGIAGLTAELAK